MTELKVGDVVMLKTGGPRMTVLRVKKKKCLCAFFLQDSLNTLKIPIGSLENVTEVSYDETFKDFVQARDDSDASALVDDSSLNMLTKYIKEDQPAILARIEEKELVFTAVEPEVEAAPEREV